MDLGIKNKVALVTAASQGLGKASALELAKEGVRLAIEARKQLSKNVLVAGGVSYWTWTGRKPSFKELSSSIETQANIMKNMGVDFLILEMMVDMEQMITTLDAVKKTKMPIWVGLTCSIDDKGCIYLGESVEAAIENGESLEKAVMYLNEIDVDAICIMHTRIKDTLNCLKDLKDNVTDETDRVYDRSKQTNKRF